VPTYAATHVDEGHQPVVLTEPGSAIGGCPIINTNYPRTAYVDDPYVGAGPYTDNVFPLRDDTLWDGWYISGIEHWDVIEGKILIKPSHYPLGLVVDDLWRDGLIWNNRSTVATVMTINKINDDGIVLTGLEVSDEIPARQDNTHTYQILREGPASIDARFEFLFGVGSVAQTITGFRGVVFPLRPKEMGYAEGREWHTSVFRSDNGSEQRATLTNATPPRVVRFPVRAHRWEERALAENLLRFGSSYSFLVPLWFSASELDAATDGTDVLSVETTDREFAVDGFVALIRRNRNNPFATIRQIAAKTSSSITVTEPVDNGAFAEGDFCIPAILCTFPEGANWNDRSTRLGDLVVVFEEL
jgi:hypothetical protein